MKKSIAVAVIAFATLAVNAQQGGGQPAAPQQHGGQGGSSAQRPPPPSPEKMAAAMMEKFDADKDGKLNVTELTAALAAHRQHAPRGHHSETNGAHHAEGNTGTQAQGEKRPELPPPASVAEKMIEHFAADKTALTLPELEKALAAHRPPKMGPGGRPVGPQGAPQGGQAGK